MEFGEVFADIRKRRRMSTREFPGISSSYIHAVEKNGVLPSLDRFFELSAHIGNVALEQRSYPESIQEEQIDLRSAWIENHFTRLGIDPHLATAMAKFIDMNAEQQAVVVASIENMANSQTT